MMCTRVEIMSILDSVDHKPGNRHFKCALRTVLFGFFFFFFFFFWGGALF